MTCEELGKEGVDVVTTLEVVSATVSTAAISVEGEPPFVMEGCEFVR